MTEKGAIAAGHELTAKAGIEVLRAGGNAFDAAISACLAACVCEPVLASPGGGGFAMIRTGSDEVSVIDFFARTPRHVSPGAIDYKEIHADFGPATQKFHIGAASSATPGFVQGIFTLHNKFGRLPISDLFTSAIQYAKHGFELTPFQHFLQQVVSPILTATASAREIFAPDGKLLAVGDHFKNPELADFLKQMAKKGPAAFLQGPVHDEIIRAQADGGHLRDSDFANYHIAERSSLDVDLPGARIHLNPPPSAGGAMIACALEILKDDSPAAIADSLAKINQLRTDCDGNIAEMLKTSGPAAYRGTTQISVVDNDGNACSLTLSNGEGNGTIVKHGGFMLNNMLGEADINPHGRAGWPTDTRMSSMMCPTIIDMDNGSIWALGSGGSNRIRSVILQMVINLVMKKDTPQQAIERPRLHVEGSHLDFEDHFPANIRKQLTKAFSDHKAWPDQNLFFGGCHIAGKSAGILQGIGDPRREGVFMSI